MAKTYASSAGERVDTELAKVLLATELRRDKAQLTLRELRKLFREGVRSGGETKLTQTAEDALEVVFDGPAGGAKVRLFRGGFVEGSVEDPARALARLESALAALGFSRCGATKRPRVSGAPSVEVSCQVKVDDAWRRQAPAGKSN